MKNDIAKYFWSLNEKALAETERVLRDPAHPLYSKRAITLMARCDVPKELFGIIPKDRFIDRWAAIRKEWRNSGASPDHLAWWDAIYRNLISAGDVHPDKAGSRHLGHIGLQFKKARMKKNWTQAELARRVGMGQREISAIENGKSNITAATLIKLARALGLKRIELVHE